MGQGRYCKGEGGFSVDLDAIFMNAREAHVDHGIVMIHFLESLEWGPGKKIDLMTIMVLGVQDYDINPDVPRILSHVHYIGDSCS